MTEHRRTEHNWDTWKDFQKEVMTAWLSGDLAGAIRLLDQHLEKELPPDLRRQVIAFRGDLHEENGNLETAKADFSAALDLSEWPDYQRYTLEVALGAIARKLGELGEADSWYFKALETAAIDFATSGGTALHGFIVGRRGRSLDEEERFLVEKVVRQGWHLLRVEGEPDFSDLSRELPKN